MKKQYLVKVQLIARLQGGTKDTKRTGDIVLSLTNEEATNPALISKEFLNLPENLHRDIPKWILGKTREAYQAEKVISILAGPLGLKEVQLLNSSKNDTN